MFDPIFRGNVQGRKHPVIRALAGPELVSYNKPKCVLQNKNNGHTNRNDEYKYQGEIELYQGTQVKGTHNDTQNQKNAQPKPVL